MSTHRKIAIVILVIILTYLSLTSCTHNLNATVSNKHEINKLEYIGGKVVPVTEYYVTKTK